MNRKGFAAIVVIGIIVAIVVVGAIGYFAWKHTAAPEPAAQVLRSTSLVSPTIPSGTVIFSVNVGQFQISLSAKDQQQSTASGFCGVNDGAVEYTGDYHLMSKNGSTTISNINIGQTFFTADLPHDGLQEFTASNGDKLLGMYEYKGCSNEAVEFFKVGSNGIISPVNFMSKDGSISQTETTGPDGSILADANGDWGFCGYDNAIGFNLCDSFAYTGINFSQADSWAGPTSNPQPADEARRALIDYISNLNQKDCANGISSNTCLLYDSIEDVTSTAPNTFLFSVDFYQGVGISTSGTPVRFNLQKTASGFNVIGSMPPPFSTGSDVAPVTTYTNQQYGFSITYLAQSFDPQISINSTSSIDYSMVGEGEGLSLLVFNDTSTPFKNKIYNPTMDSYDDSVAYATTSRQWIVSGNSVDSSLCPTQKYTDQGVPYYAITTGHHDGDDFNVYITTNGIIAAAGGEFPDNSGTISQDEVVFKNPKTVLTAGCVVMSTNQALIQGGSLAIPAIYTGNQWKLASSSYDALDISPSLNFDGTVTGQLYEATNTDPGINTWEQEVKTCDDCPFYQGDQSFLTFYYQALSANGYQTLPLYLDQNFNITSSNNPTYLLSPVSGDGPRGTVDGYIAHDNYDNVRVVVVSSDITQNELFISNIINLRTLLLGTSTSN
jgi:hypothetical protein